MKRKCLFLLLAAGLLCPASGQARIIKKTKIGRPVKQNSETVAPYETIAQGKGGKSVGVADSIANVTGGQNDLTWRCMGSPGGRNIGEGPNHGLAVIYARATGLTTNIGILMYGYSLDGGATWAAIELLPGEQLRRFYSAVAVDARGYTHFACQSAKVPYSGFSMLYLLDESGVGGALLTYPCILNDTTLATGTTPYVPNIVVSGTAG
ncbi:MAG: hypothetical protein ACYDEQ_07375, partial [Desulfocucumaceae bacterium]